VKDAEKIVAVRNLNGINATQHLLEKSIKQSTERFMTNRAHWLLSHPRFSGRSQ